MRDGERKVGGTMGGKGGKWRDEQTQGSKVTRAIMILVRGDGGQSRYGD